ncbi:MAG: pyridoxamine 5'-phosphate oxidase family protein, partial [Frankiales bacterium]|nr:pyridoxamine 5'-phosphate oxidase family protein [Frankiales bacterium]
MLETADDLTAMRELLDASLTRSGPHLRSIIEPGRRTPSVEQILAELDGMRVLVIATVGPDGRPRTSCVDGHFLRGHWVFTTSGDAVKARDLTARPAVSATYVDSERFALFVHGDAESIDPDSAADAWVERHLVEHYGESPRE